MQIYLYESLIPFGPVAQYVVTLPFEWYRTYSEHCAYVRELCHAVYTNILD